MKHRKETINEIQKLKDQAVPREVLERGRSRLLAVMNEDIGGDASSTATFAVFRPVMRYAVSFAIIVLLVGTGVVVAARDALPGDPLYFAKRAGEQVRLALEPDLSDRAALQASYAERRLAEARVLVSRGGDIALQGEVRNALLSSHEYLVDTQEALDTLMLDQSEKSRAAVDVIEMIAAQQEEGLREISDSDTALRSDVTTVTLDLLEIEKRAALSDASDSNEDVPFNEEEVAPPPSSDVEIAAAQGEEPINEDPQAELRAKVEVKIEAADKKHDVVEPLILEDLRAIERDQDRNAVSDIVDRFNAADGFLDRAKEEASEERYRMALTFAFDALSMLTELEDDVLDLIDVIVADTTEEASVEDVEEGSDEEEPSGETSSDANETQEESGGSDETSETSPEKESSL